MAEDKKKDDKKPAAPSPGMDPLFIVVGLIFLVGLLLSSLNGVLFDNTNGKIVFPQGDVSPGKEIILRETSAVRNAPGGPILGRQTKYEKASIKEGPIDMFGKTWYRVDFESAPSGWIESEGITSYVSAYYYLNILPIMWKYVRPILWGIIVLLTIMILYFKSRLAEATDEASRKLNSDVIQTVPHIVIRNNESGLAQVLPGEIDPESRSADKQGNQRWMHVLQLLESYNQSDWRQSIIEADIILETMLDKMGYDGISIGDKLKNVESSDFLTLNQAWEAHKVRNKIAHMGSEYKVSQHEARKVISLYQEVFEEFYFI